MLSVLTQKRNEQIRFEEWLEEKQELKREAEDLERFLALPIKHEVWSPEDENEEMDQLEYKKFLSKMFPSKLPHINRNNNRA